MKKAMALLALTVLSACDVSDDAAVRKERSDSQYKSAMEDYRAGRIGAAISGFENALRKNPANASARFQLACLLQDSKRDYARAFCGYHEYVLQHPDSDKAKLAKDRLTLCEKELAKELATKHGLLGSTSMINELDSAKKSQKSASMRAAMAEKELEVAKRQIVALTAERERLLSIVKSGAGEEDDASVVATPSAKEVRDLLDEDDSEDRVKLSDDIAALKSEEADEVSAGSSLLPPAPRPTAQDAPPPPARDDAAGANSKPTALAHPRTYVVQEGDTLYKIAKRFYGRNSAWRIIRDANKELISTDGRLRVGDTIRIP